MCRVPVNLKYPFLTRLYIQYLDIFLMMAFVILTALDGFYEGVGGVHPGPGTAGPQRQPGDDAGISTLHSGKKKILFV